MFCLNAFFSRTCMCVLSTSYMCTCAYMLRTCVSMGVVLGIEPRTSCMLSKDSITELQQVGKSTKWFWDRR